MNYIKHSGLLVIIASFLWTPMFTNGQEKIEVIPVYKEMKKGTQNGYKVNIPLEDIKTVEKEWGKFITGGAKVKVIKDKSGIQAEGSIINRITRSPLNIYSVIYEDKTGVKLEAYFEADSAFIADDPSDSRSGAITAFLHDFSVERYREAFKEMIEAEDDILEDMQKSMQELIEEKSDLERSIGKSQRGIDKLENDITENASDYDRKSQEIEKQKDHILDVKNLPDEHKAQKKVLKKLRKEQSSLEKEKESMHDGIYDYKEEILKAEREIAQNGNMQSQKELEIEKQKEKIKLLNKQLDDIK